MTRDRKHLAYLAAFAMACFSLHAQADNSQQSKMTSCNADAKTQNLAGDARKSFMKTCLSAAPATPAAAPAAAASGNSQQMKMKSCNADAKTKALSGDARKQFMSSCLKSSS